MTSPSTPTPLIVSISMGYGHLRAAWPLARALGTAMLHADQPPLAEGPEQVLWARTRAGYEAISRGTTRSGVGRLFRGVLEGATAIPPLYPERDRSAPTWGCRLLDWLADRRGLGQGLVGQMRATGAPLLTTYFVPAILADRHDCGDISLVVTDTDINRAWVPSNPAASRIRFMAPSRRAVRRLRSYGVRPEQIHYTGFPLPAELLGGEDLGVLRRNLAARLVRLDPEGVFRAAAGRALEAELGPLPGRAALGPPRIVFAVGGAGAQADLAARLVGSLAPALVAGELQLVLVAGVRSDVAAQLEAAVGASGLEARAGGAVEILLEPTHEAYFERFNDVLARADLLWTKPSEMVFYAALGLPLMLSDPIGVHEHYNRRWVLEHGAGLSQRDPAHAAEHLRELLADGVLAAMAWSGYRSLPNRGLYEILRHTGPAEGP
jgi:hypothetical protein